MGRNIEIKARATDFDTQRRKAGELAGAAPETLTQEDTFFTAKRGRLKLRLFDENRGELIYYERSDASGPAESRYMILPTHEPAALRDALSQALGVSGVVRKRREVYHVAGTRVHLDEVEGLGEFVELEAVLGPGESSESGAERVRELSSALGIDVSDLIDGAYIDLLTDGEKGQRDMISIEVRDMQPEDEYFVSTCTHEDESEEIDASGKRRLAWLRSHEPDGLRVKVALVDGRRVGFLFAMPAEVSPWGPLGEDLMVFPCLFVKNDAQGQGAGRALIEAAENEARKQDLKGIATFGYYWEDFWFMPAPFFEHAGYQEVERKGDSALKWKPLAPDATPPRMLKPSYEFEPVPGRVVVDLFWHTFCLTCDEEAARVKEVAAEFGDSVVLREYCGDDRDILLKHQIPRAIYVNGREIGWGYEAPRDGIRDAIRAALELVEGGEA